MTKATVFLIYREHTDDKILEIVQGLKDYKGYDSALVNTEIEIVPWRNMRTFSEIYHWIVPALRKMARFAVRTLLWVFPPDMQANFEEWLRPVAEKLGTPIQYPGQVVGFADVPKGCGFVLGGDALVYVVHRIEHELTHITWALTWHGRDNKLLDQVRLYEGREAWPWVEKGNEVTIEGRAYRW